MINFKSDVEILFVNEKLPQIYELLDKYKIGRNIIIFKSRTEADSYIKSMDKK